MSREEASSAVDLHSLYKTSELSDALHTRCVKMTAFVHRSLNFSNIAQNWSKMVQTEVRKYLFLYMYICDF